MKHLAAAALALWACAAPLIGGDAQTQPAQTAALDWLKHADAGQYGQSWDSAAGLFRAAITRDAWVTAIQSVRAPLGQVKGRTLKSATLTRNMPGAPDGEYVVLSFATQFENKLQAVETVTPRQELDGSWKVAGYFVR